MELYEDNMYILKEYRRLKIGSKLIDKFKEYCKQKEVDCIKVSAWSQNIEAIDFYKTNEFKDYERTLIYKIYEGNI